VLVWNDVGITLIDMSVLFGFLKKSEMSFSSPIRGIESGNSRWKKDIKAEGVSSVARRDSGRKSVHVKDLSSVSKVL
jgi:hypothetical protein